MIGSVAPVGWACPGGLAAMKDEFPLTDPHDFETGGLPLIPSIFLTGRLANELEENPGAAADGEGTPGSVPYYRRVIE